MSSLLLLGLLSACLGGGGSGPQLNSNGEEESSAAQSGPPSIDLAPVAFDVTADELFEDVPKTIYLTATDSDSLITLCSITQITNAAVSTACQCNNGLCSVGIQGATDYSGAASFKYVVLSNNKFSNEANVWLQINPVEDIFTTPDLDDVTLDEDTAHIVTLRYQDPENDQASSCTVSSLTFVTQTQACSCDGNGVCMVGVQGNTNYYGLASFKFTLFDAAKGGTSELITATLRINSISDGPPDASDDTFGPFSEESAHFITLGYSDPDGTVEVATECSLSNLTNVAISTACSCDATGECRVGLIGDYAPPAGDASFDFRVKVEGDQSDYGHITLSYIDIPHPPEVESLSPADITEDTPATLTLNYSDADDWEVATSCSVSAPFGVTIGASGCSCAAGLCTFDVTPDSNFDGTADLIANVTGDDGTSADVTLDLPVVPVDDPPTLPTNLAVDISEDTPSWITLNYNDVELEDANSCTIIGVSNVTAGACVCVLGLCTVEVTPDSNYNGNAGQLTYNVTTLNADGLSVPAAADGTQDINVLAVDDPPVPTDSLTGNDVNEEGTINIALAYSDVEGDLATDCTVDSADSTLDIGTCICDGGGNCSVDVTGDLDVYGDAHFSFSVEAAGASSVTNGDVVVTIANINDAPVAHDITPDAINEDESTTITLSYSDVDPLSLDVDCSVDTLDHVSASACSCDGSGLCRVEVTSDLDYFGPASFRYWINDSTVDSNFATANLTINNVNDAPVATTTSTHTLWASGATTITLDYTDSDTGFSDQATSCSIAALSGVSVITPPGCVCTAGVCTVQIQSDGSTSASFNYTVSDGEATSDAATITVDVGLMQCAWMHGDPDMARVMVTAGVRGTAEESNSPGGRSLMNYATDQARQYLWVYGGRIENSPTITGYTIAGDLWKFHFDSALWTWVAGSTAFAPAATYGAQGTASATAYPGKNELGAMDLDSTGRIWMFGGSYQGDDLWSYSEQDDLWTYEGGAGASSYFGTYGEKGTASAANWPGARSYNTTAWFDSNDKFWMFGGTGNAESTNGHLGDLWMFDPAIKQWTWMSGSKEANALPVYGTKGLASASTFPGGNYSSQRATRDSSGDLWLFGGDSRNEEGTPGTKNALWRYELATDRWTWMSGMKVNFQYATRGARQQFGANFYPGARNMNGGVMLSDNELIIHGGSACADGNCSSKGDYWLYSGGQWAWINGNPLGSTYASKGTMSASYYHAGSMFSMMVLDSAENIWSYGRIAGAGHKINIVSKCQLPARSSAPVGSGTTTATSFDEDAQQLITLDYSDSSGDIATSCGIVAQADVVVTQDCSCSGGICTVGVTGTTDYYGSASITYTVTANGATSAPVTIDLAINSVNDIPIVGPVSAPSLYSDVAQTITLSYSDPDYLGTATCATSDASGLGVSSCLCLADYCTATVTSSAGHSGPASFNFTVSDGEATSDAAAVSVNFTQYICKWVHGTQNNNTVATYGTMGVPAAENRISGRTDHALTIDDNGTLWVYGGWTTSATSGDLWKFEGDQWTFVAGSIPDNQVATYGVRGTASASVLPTALRTSALWSDNSNDIWLFGGSTQSGLHSSDLWRYSVSSGQWSWMGGHGLNQNGTYGTAGTASATLWPGSRLVRTYWQHAGQLYLYGQNGRAQTGTAGNLADLWSYQPALEQWTFLGGSTEINPAASFGSAGTALASVWPGQANSAALAQDASGNIWLAAGLTHSYMWKREASSGHWAFVGGQDCGTTTSGVKGVAASTNLMGGRAGAYSLVDNNQSIWIFSGSPGGKEVWRFRDNLWTWVKGDSNVNGSYGSQGYYDAKFLPRQRAWGTPRQDSEGGLWVLGGYAGNRLDDLWRCKVTDTTVDNEPLTQNLFPAAMDEETTTTVTLNYTDVEGDVATSCSVGGAVGVSLGACGSCDAGQCLVDVTGDANFVGTARFNYTVTAGGLKSIPAGGVYLTVNNVNDAPTTSNFTAPITINTNSATLITLNWADIDTGEQAQTCSVTPGAGLAIAQACACTAGVCTVGMKADTSTPGAYTFTYTVNDGTADSSSATATVEVGNISCAWVSGAAPNSLSAAGTYGTIGTASTAFRPRSRTMAHIWTHDASDEVYLFGGYNSNRSDFWKFNTATLEWTLLGGGADDNLMYGTFGDRGVPASSNYPTARHDGFYGKDSQGNFWLYGGYGLDRSAATGYLDDLWRYNPTSAEWTWMSGSGAIGGSVTYGTIGTAAAFVAPGALHWARGWIDLQDRVHIASGYAGAFSAALFRYDTTSDQWTFLGGAVAGVGTGGTRGTSGYYGASVRPAPQRGSLAFSDSLGRAYTYGGWNALYRYSPTLGQWAFLNGPDNTSDAVWGTLGVASSSNHPAYRYRASVVTLGASAYMFAGSYKSGSVQTNSVWKFDGQAWSWLAGSQSDNAAGTFTTQGTASTLVTLRAVEGPAVAKDDNNRIWIFGGSGNIGTLYSCSVATGTATPVNATTDTTMDEDAQTLITLNYTSEGGPFATSCAITDMTNVSITQDCSCSAAGECTVGVTGFGDYYGAGSFDYSITVNGATSTYSTVNLTINNVNDAPIADDLVGVQELYTDVPKTIHITGTDPDSIVPDELTDCSTDNEDGVEFQSCTCSALGCDLTIQTTSSTSGVGSFQFKIKDSNGTWSALSSAVTTNATHFVCKWVSGSTTVNHAGTTGTRGLPSATTLAPTVSLQSSTLDADGALWFFGGDSTLHTGTAGPINQLWRFEGNQWTYEAGSLTSSPEATYGARGTASASVAPPAGRESMIWVDASSDLWLFGGYRHNTTHYRGDLWKFHRDLGQWSWQGGPQANNSYGTYGTFGTSGAHLFPGARHGQDYWSENGKFFLLGGYGYGVSGGAADLGDLWSFDPATLQWTLWANPGVMGTVGSFGTASSSVWPGGSIRRSVVVDPTGALWMAGSNVLRNNIWKRQTDGQWAFMSGSNTSNQRATYGVQGVASATNTISGRVHPAILAPDGQNLWVWGGYDGTGYRNDAWHFDGAQWTWVRGPNEINLNGTYTTKGQYSAQVWPKVRSWYVPVQDQEMGLWIFAGGNGQNFDDLWRCKVTDEALDNEPLTQNIFPAAINEDGTTTVTLNYTDIEGDVATSCSVGAAYGVTLGTCGSCDASQCLVDVTADANFNGTARFNYTVTAGGLKSVPAGGVYLTVNSVNDAPTTSNFTAPIMLNTNSATLITLNWADADTGEQAQTCSVTPGGGLAIAQACACTAGVCTVGMKADTSTPGAYTFTYTVNDGSADSNSATVTVEVGNVSCAWVSGAAPDVLNAAGTYGSIGTASTDFSPKARQLAHIWSHDVGHELYLFGGIGSNHLGDFWRFNTSTFEWTLLGGGSGVGAMYGTFGTRGVASVNNLPTARHEGFYGKDSQGNFWLFGGSGLDRMNTGNYLDDLWRYNPTTSEWTWVNGTGAGSPLATYGSVGTADAVVSPGGLHFVRGWIDQQDRIYIASAKTALNLYSSELFRYDVTADQWTFLGGITHSAASTGGTRGTPGYYGAEVRPAPQWGGLAFSDSRGRGYSYGGVNSVYRYSPTLEQWAFLNGNDDPNAVVWGTLGVASGSNTPGFRYRASSVVIGENAYMFGGTKVGIVKTNSVWKFDGQAWSWLAGSQSGGVVGTFTTRGTASTLVTLRATDGLTVTKDGNNRIWIFGGLGAIGSLYGCSVATGTAAPINTATDTTMDEDTQTLITLSYTSEAGPFATSCAITDMTNVLITQACSCSAAGECTVGVTGFADYVGSASFDYTITTNGVTSASSTLNLTITALNEAPVATTTTVTAIYSDTTTDITLAYTDAENDDATTCALTPGTGISADSTCSCDGSGVCVAALVSTAQFYGSAQFNYTVTAGGSVSNSRTVDLNVLRVVCTWLSGPATGNQRGTYGEQGTGATIHRPGARRGSSSWYDVANDLLWLFGGEGVDASGTVGLLNDLWSYGPASGQWTWVKGANTTATGATYGTLGTGSADFNPSARTRASASSDRDNNRLMLFGGSDLADLWSFDPATNQWSLRDGSPQTNQQPIYAVTPHPGSRTGAALIYSQFAGDLWLMGGESSSGVRYDDLWKFDNGSWSLQAGREVGNGLGTYGTQDVGAASNQIGARAHMAMAANSNEEFWIFAGAGIDTQGTATTSALHNDVWKYDGSNWIWKKGLAQSIEDSDNRGTAGIKGRYTDITNIPVRYEMSSAQDSNGNLWLFGGRDGQVRADFWQYNLTSNQWRWMGGNYSGATQYGTYSTQGETSLQSWPGGRATSAYWIDNGSVGVMMWIFGGYGNSATDEGQYLNDLWKCELLGD